MRVDAFAKLQATNHIWHARLPHMCGLVLPLLAAAFKWAKKPSHAPFCYELLVAMLALASSTDSASGGAEFASSVRRSRMLALLVTGLRREPLRTTCVPLAAKHVWYAKPRIPVPACRLCWGTSKAGMSQPTPYLNLLPALVISALSEDAIRIDLETPTKGSSATATSLKMLVASLMPRRAVISSNETIHIEQTLLALASAQPDCSYAIGLIIDSLDPAGNTATPPSQRALLLRLLTRLSEENPEAISPHQKHLLGSLRPALRAEAHQHLSSTAAVVATAAAGAGGTPPTPDLDGGGFLPAVIGAVPWLWPREADAEEVCGTGPCTFFVLHHLRTRTPNAKSARRILTLLGSRGLYALMSVKPA